MTKNIDLIAALQMNTSSTDVFAVCNGKNISYASFWQHVSRMRTLLPKLPYLINYCEDRYLFCVALFAAALNGSITLLPPSKSSGIVVELEHEYGCLCAISDQQLSGFSIDQLIINQALLDQQISTATLPECNNTMLDPQQVMVIAFTSGSTGHPKAQLKHWGDFVDCAQRAIQQLGFENQQFAMLSTTPPQHMFGLETSVMWPFISQLILVNQRPFYPEDIRLAIQSMPYPVILCSTPTHLRACIRSAGQWTNLAAIICSTAPLSPMLAKQIETGMGVELHELFGSTETLSYATRRTTQHSAWTPYSDVKLETHANGVQLNAAYLQQPVLLDDMLNIQTNGHFKVVGRATDLVKVGGKRASIAELNQRLQAIPGITDGCFFRIERADAELRLGAIVVSKLDIEIIIKTLKQHLDEVFLPRTVYYTDTIPRNSMGKLVDAEITTLVKQLRESPEFRS
jgi:acyl-coenzyme A synthetase/AMP-(fatty) acid ligase